jgi:cellulose synthase/poly-beta-1,6-N-acetylglucosamine synthase-like glycosyltransferase
MISIITVAPQKMLDSVQERNIKKTCGLQFEYILSETKGTNLGTGEALRSGFERSKGDVIVFMPEDAYFMKPGWGVVLENKFRADPTLGMIGIAGTQYFSKESYSWTSAGRPFIKGRIIHHLVNDDFFATVFSQENGNFDVVACDETFLAIRRSFLEKLGIDTENFGGNHFYGIDIALRMYGMARVLVTTEIVVKRRSAQVFDEQWKVAGTKLLEKFHGVLPVRCVQEQPGPPPRPGAQTVNLAGKAPKETIC